jgi:23S rRNA pseudouridine2605 synthase
MSDPIRLQKILAEAGFGSRRACEEFIVDGRVAIDGQVVRELGVKADPTTQSITLDGQNVAGPGRTSKLVKEQGQKVYYMLNKPRGVLCTNEDPAGRPLAIQLIPDRRRIFCVGRLDIDTEGLVLLTNDGDLTNLLTHPRYGVHKSYVAKVDGKIDGGQIMKLQTGVHLAEGKTQGALVRVRKRAVSSSVIEMEISEGMNRQIRRMLAAVNLNCRSLKRVRVGPVRLGGLPVGAARQLTRDEVDSLYFAAEKAKQNAEAGVPNKPFLPRQSRDDVKSWREGHYQEVDDRKDDDSDERKDYTEAKPLWKEKKGYGNPKNPNDKRPWKPMKERESGGGFGGKPAWTDKKSFGEKRGFSEKREWKPKGEFRPREGGGDRGGFGGKPAWKDKKSFGGEKREWKPKGEFRSREGGGGSAASAGFGGKPAWKDKKSFGDKREYKPRGEFNRRTGEDRPRKPRDAAYQNSRPQQEGVFRPAFQEKPEWKQRREERGQSTFKGKRDFQSKRQFRRKDENQGGNQSFEQKPYGFKNRDENRQDQGGQSGGYARKFEQKRPWQGKRDGDRQSRQGFKKFKPFKQQQQDDSSESGQ